MRLEEARGGIVDVDFSAEVEKDGPIQGPGSADSPAAGGGDRPHERLASFRAVRCDARITNVPVGGSTVLVAKGRLFLPGCTQFQQECIGASTSAR